MKHLRTTFTVLAIALAIPGCKKASDSTATASKSVDKSADKPSDPPAAKAPTLTINEADWEVKDLKTISPMIGVSMKVPKGAKLEKNGNGGVDITISDFYMLTVSAIAVSKIAGAIESDKSLTIGNTTSYQNGKALLDEPNGFIYQMQMKDEANGTKYQPETHFAFYLDKDGAIYSILDQKPTAAMDTPGSTYSEALARQVYAIVKASAK